MIAQEEAIKIAKDYHGPAFEFYSITHGVPANCSLYGNFSRAPDDVWCVLCSSHPGNHNLLCSSRAIVISKNTGKILYDGSAHDEG